MKIRESVYGFIIIGILLGGLFITNIAGLWEVSPNGQGERHGPGGRHQVTIME